MEDGNNMIKKHKKKIIIIIAGIFAVLLLLFILSMPPKRLTLGELFEINGQSYTARFMFRGKWHDFSDSQYESFSDHLNDELERFMEISSGHHSTGDYITIEITCENGAVTVHTLDSDLFGYNKGFSYIPSDELLEFIKSLPESIQE